MAPPSDAPYRAQDIGEVTHMVQALESHTRKGKGKGGFSVKKNTFVVPDGRKVDSWRLQDWDYKKPNLPTYARGLFTWKNSKGQNEIAVRGYDKFFNHGEVKKTEWQNVRNHTRGPYELSVKENGCIIFISALDDTTLLVCSKHSTGARADVEVSHAVAGERWVEKHLASVGKTKGDLAKKLREMNATAVAELCDDSFEEHVLAYGNDIAGLYLHGINLNLPEFATYPHRLVDEFAREWGFRQTMFVLEDDIERVKSFLDKVAETGHYNGRDTEGFVIRCQARDGDNGPWYDWFFKYKFDEPYLMYRQWRECTKAVIKGWQPKIRKHKKITEEYLLFARRRLATDPNLGKLYNQNHGIIGLRDDFLKSRGLTGADIINQEIESGDLSEVTNNVVLVPIATIGCGKTTLGQALCKLFGWAEFQNDNVQGKGNRPKRFVTQITMLMAQSPVVFADRNNHQRRERAQLINDVSQIVPKTTFVALHWVHNRDNYDQIRQKLRDRVFARGDNHQTIHAGSGEQEVAGIMEGFLQRFERADPDAPPDNGFDFIINLDPLAPTRDNLETVISKLHDEYPKLFPEDMPTAAALDDAISAAMNDYKPDVKHSLDFGSGASNSKSKLPRNGTIPVHATPATSAGKKQKPPKVEYFAVRIPAARILAVLDATFRELPAPAAAFYRQLATQRRLQAEFHVTLMHRASAAAQPESWARLTGMWEAARSREPENMEPELGKCGVQVERVVWDGRVMGFVVRLLSDGGDEWASVNRVAHVTVGTASATIKPKESNDMLAKWLDGVEGTEGLTEEKIKGNVVLEGTVRGVLQKL